MTTSYELSLRLKELGSPQVGGEYYWVKSHGGEIYRVYGNTIRLNGCDGSILCRAFTLGELVRELGGDRIIEMRLYTGITGLVTYLRRSSDLFGKESTISPEEAAGELWAELLKQEKQRVC